MNKNITRRDGERFAVVSVSDADKADALGARWKLERRATEEEDKVVDMSNSELQRRRENGIDNGGWIKRGGGGKGGEEGEHGGTEKQRCDS